LAPFSLVARSRRRVVRAQTILFPMNGRVALAYRCIQFLTRTRRKDLPPQRVIGSVQGRRHADLYAGIGVSGTAARAADFSPIRINMVVLAGVNDHETEAM
jgi:hypothetical protein